MVKRRKNQKFSGLAKVEKEIKLRIIYVERKTHTKSGSIVILEISLIIYDQVAKINLLSSFNSIVILF